MMEFRLGERKLGPGHPCFIIAEAGVNHNGSRQTAHDLVDAAASAGADAVKFQTWITERICAQGAKKAAYQDAQCPEEADQFTMLKKLELPYEWHPELQKRASEKGLMFLSTPDEIQSAKFLCELGVPAIKIGSAELTNHLYLRQLASLGKPLILSTGMGTLEEVRAAVAVIRSVGQVPVAMLHCVSAYPAPDEEMNLRCLVSLRQAFKTPIGLSDHTPGSVAAIVAVGVGMDILEKHLTLDKRAAGPDHSASADPTEFAELVRTVRKAERMLGDGIKAPAASEAGTRAAVRRTLLYTRDLASGHVLGFEDVEALRCGLCGLGPEDAPSLERQRLRRSVNAGSPVSRADFA
jgi:N-acetylneuraminate synthase/N,N'-diacetyllegionaminate synthase